MRVPLLLLALMIPLFQEGTSLTCLHCDHIFQPRHCRTVIACKDNEICGSELVSSNHGSNLYNIGCFPKTTCDKSALTNRTCLQCCGSDLCNVDLCSQPDYPSPRGPVCFGCPVYSKNSPCNDIEFCADDEVCNVKAKLEFSDMVYTSSCVTKGYCSQRNSLGSELVGKRSIQQDKRTHEHELCDVCCSSDVCNQDCDSALTDLDECKSSPCVNGTCVDSVGTYKCVCDAGFTGPTCNIDLKNCGSSPCLHGLCVDIVGTYRCICEAGFTGPNCDTDDRQLNPCASNPCSFGKCIDYNGTFTCNCDSGFTGRLCETDIDECLSHQCGNGTCVDGINNYTCICDSGWTGAQCQTGLSDCVDIRNAGNSMSGVYTVKVNTTNETVEVFCDMDTDGGGWTIFQYRLNGSVDFYRNFTEYEYGFGNLNGEFWLGLHYLYHLTQQPTELRIDLVAADNSKAYETFKQFSVHAGSRYSLSVSSSSATISPTYKGFLYNNGESFSTYDNDRSGYDCARKDRGGWWYDDCTYANLNGHYAVPGNSNGYNNRGEAGMTYRSFKDEESLKSSKMMLRRR